MYNNINPLHASSLKPDAIAVCNTKSEGGKMHVMMKRKWIQATRVLVFIYQSTSNLDAWNNGINGARKTSRNDEFLFFCGN